MEDYFTGGVPFTGIKSRKDIPDAFIFSSIIDLTREYRHLFFATYDKALAAKVRSLHKIHVIDELSLLFENKMVKAALSLIENQTQLQKARKILLFHRDQIRKKLIDLIANEVAEHDFPEDKLEDFMQGVDITRVSGVRFASLDYDNLRRLTDESFALDFTAIVESEVDGVTPFR